MIKPKYVDNLKSYSRQDAVKAMGISQASFSKYFAVNNDKRTVYLGVYLNQRIDQLLGKDTDEPDWLNIADKIQERAINMLNDKTETQPCSARVNDNYQSLNDISYIIHKMDDGYLVGTENVNTIVKAEKRKGTYVKYILPIIKMWMNQTDKPNIALVSVNNDFGLSSNPNADTHGQWISYSKRNNYEVGKTTDLVVDEISILKDNTQYPSALWIPVTHTNANNGDFFDFTQPMINSKGIAGILDILLFAQIRNKHHRNLKIIIDDLNTNILNNKYIKQIVPKLLSIGNAVDIETTIITDKNLTDEYTKNAHVINNVETLPMDAELFKHLKE